MASICQDYFKKSNVSSFQIDIYILQYARYQTNPIYERGIKRLVATVNWKISVYSSNIFVLTKEPHQEADTSKLGNIQIIKSDELKMLF